MTHPISISFPNSEFSKTYVGIFAQVTPAVDMILSLKNNVDTSTDGYPNEDLWGIWAVIATEFSKTYVGIFAQVTPAADILLCLKKF